jgi:hypothetical protein
MANDIAGKVVKFPESALWDGISDKSCLLAKLDLNTLVPCPKRFGVGSISLAANFLLSGGEEREKRTLPVLLGAAASNAGGNDRADSAAADETHSYWYYLIIGALGDVCASVLTMWLTRPTSQA